MSFAVRCDNLALLPLKLSDCTMQVRYGTREGCSNSHQTDHMAPGTFVPAGSSWVTLPKNQKNTGRGRKARINTSTVQYRDKW